MEDPDEITIDGDIVHGTFSTRAPKIKLNPVRFLLRNSTLFFILKIFLFFFVVGVLSVLFWSKVLGGILVAIALLLAAVIWRYLSLRRIEFKNAVLTAGVVIAQKPPTILILANMSCGGAKAPIWAVKLEQCRSLEPLSAEVGTRIPCVTAFLGSGFGESWDKIVSSPLTSGTGDRKLLEQALSRLDDKEEWRVLNYAVETKKFPDAGKTLRL